MGIDITGDIAGIVLTLKGFGAPPPFYFPLPTEHDFLVSLPSQRGGLPAGTNVITAIGYSPGKPAHHLTVTKDDAIAVDVVGLLNTPVGDTTVFAPEFPAAGGGGIAGSGALPPYGDIVSGIVISDPLPGALVNPGEQRSVTVNPTDGFVPVHVIIGSIGDTVLIESAPFTSDIQIPVDAIGAISFSAIAFDSDWNIAIAQDVVVTADVAASLTGIAFDPDVAFLLAFAADYQLRVFGTFDDGVNRDVTAPQRGTEYASLNPEIATIDEAGLVTAVSVGVATVQATNGMHSDTAQVFVETVTCVGDINIDAVVDTVDLLALLGAWGQCPALPDPCPADVSGDGVVDVVDLLLVLGNWGPCS